MFKFVAGLAVGIWLANAMGEAQRRAVAKGAERAVRFPMRAYREYAGRFDVPEY